MTVHGRIPRGSYSAFRRERTSYGGVGEFSGLRQVRQYLNYTPWMNVVSSTGAMSYLAGFDSVISVSSETSRIIRP